MGFQPSKTHPVRIRLCGSDCWLSIMSARLHAMEVRALIAEAELAEEREYLEYRVRLYETQLQVLRSPKGRAKK